MLHNRSVIVTGTDLRSLADELLGAHAGGQRNPMWRCPNPNHAQTGRTPPVRVFNSHRGEQRWRCHGCGMGGTAIDLVVVARNENVFGALVYLSGRQRNGAPAAGSEWQHDQRPPARPDPEGFARYVDDCARRLWRPEGRQVRDWLTGDRGLDAEVLRVNRIGADPGPRTQWRPQGIPRAAGAVLTALDANGTPVYAQLRLLRPRADQPRYLNPAGGLLENPRLTRIRPPDQRRRPVIVTEGAIDALTAASAGYRAVAILGAGYPDELIAAHLARLSGPIVLAFDPDAAGTHGSDRLASLLAARHRPALRLPAGRGDLNDQRIATDGDWSRRLDALVAAATPTSRSEPVPRDGGVGVA